MADIRINALATTATTPASDDYLALDGTAQGTRKILATNIANNVTDVILGTSGPSVKASLSARAPRQGLVFDGSAGATVSGVAAFGSSDFSVAAWINQTSAANAQIVGASTNGFVLYLRSTGKMLVLKQDTGGTSDSTGSVTAGKTTLVVYTKSGTTGTFYFNGIAGGTVTDNFDYTVAFSTVGKSGSNAEILNGLCIPFAYNRALSASEVVSLYEAGAPAGADYNSASNTAINTSAFVSDGTTITGFTSTATSWSGTTTDAFGTAAVRPDVRLMKGGRYRLTYTYTGSIPVQLVDGAGFSLALSTGTAVTVEFTYTGTGGFRTAFNPTSAGAVSMSGISLVRLGLLLAPDAAQAGGGLVWYDTSGNAANITLPASGVTWNVPTSGKTATGWSFNSPLLVGTTIDAGYTITARATDASIAAMSSDASSQLRLNAQSGIAILETVTNTPLRFRTNSTEAMRLFANGNLFVGASPVDGGQKLQVSGTASITGNLTVGGQNLNFGGTGNSFNDIRLYDSTATGGTTRIRAEGGGLKLFVYDTLAMAIASDTNATFAGNVYAGSSGTTRGLFRVFSTTANAEGNFYGRTGGGVTIDTNGNGYPIRLDGVRVELGSPLRLNNAYVAGAPTATGYVTIQDSAGNTYKVLVGT